MRGVKGNASANNSGINVPHEGQRRGVRRWFGKPSLMAFLKFAGQNPTSSQRQDCWKYSSVLWVSRVMVLNDAGT